MLVLDRLVTLLRFAVDSTVPIRNMPNLGHIPVSKTAIKNGQSRQVGNGGGDRGEHRAFRHVAFYTTLCINFTVPS